MYSVFIQWHENTSNYRRFDGGLEVVSKRPSFMVEAANERTAEWLYYYSDDYTHTSGDDGEPLLYNNNRHEIAVKLHIPEPASYDFGDGTIYVAEVVE